ncbi:MAG: ATP-binding cassette domain-containing protein [Anaerolineales bacterium]|nr:ATP-binding cassette domain-containing protein [Anaerolineales bacterium]
MKDELPVIRTDNLTKRFKNITAVNEVSFSVQKGEIFGFLGPNGAGKTTTIGMLLGLVRPTSGSAEILGYDIRGDICSALQQVGAIVENPAFYPYMSGIENLRMFARIDGGDTQEEIPRIVKSVGLESRGKDKVSTYSMGMRQRLGLASALLGDPELLIMDEPTNGLDPAGMQEMRVFIRRLAKEEGKTVFLSSHLLHEVEQVCDRVLILNKGKVIAQGSVEELLSQAYGVEIRIENVEQSVEVLSRLDWPQNISYEKDLVYVQAPPERAPELVAALAAHDLYPSEVRPVVSTLESVFLGLTNEGIEETDA